LVFFNKIGKSKKNTVEAEVPGAARVNLQLAELLLFCKQFSKMCPSAFRVSGPQSQGWSRGPRLKLHQNLPWTGGDVHAKYYQDLSSGLDFHLPSMYQQTYTHIYIFILAEVLGPARVNLQPAEILCFVNSFQKCFLQCFRPSRHRGQGVKPAPKPSLDRLWCECKISSRSVQGFGFQLALHIPTDSKQTSVYTPIFIYI